jgi:gamma-glutamylcyclotransferase (GGCT)/AIG2-like uncharacterized protein YtfP
MDFFLYGSLMFPAVYEGVTGVSPLMEDAVLDGYRRYAVQNPQGSSYPGIIAQAGCSVLGKLVRNVSADEVAALDAFEGLDRGLYHRERVIVGSGEVSLTAFTYVAGPALLPYLAGDWSAEEFERTKLRRFLQIAVLPLSPQRKIVVGS